MHAQRGATHWAVKVLIVLGIFCLGCLISLYTKPWEKNNRVTSPTETGTEIPRGRRLDAALPDRGDFTPSSTMPSASLALLRAMEPKVKDGELVFTHTEDGFLKLPFSILNDFEYDIGYRDLKSGQLGPIEDRVPRQVLDLDKTEVMLIGFMVPIDIDFKNRKVKSFALTQNIAFCCYGIVPDMNELIICRFDGDENTDFFDNIPIAVYGELLVSEAIGEQDIASLYRMRVARVVTLKEIVKRQEAQTTAE